MIAEQLKKFKKTIKIKYSQSEDLDAESLLDLIPDKIEKTKYLSTASLHFDRLRLTSSEEVKFNKKFKEFLKSLIIYGNEEGFEYLLDFLIRKYHILKYNQKELLFLTLPFPKFYINTLEISKFEFLKNQKTLSTKFISECCVKYVDFFYFVLDYFDYYDFLKNFLDELLNNFVMHKHITDEIKEKFPLDHEIVEKLNKRKIKEIETESRILKKVDYNEEIYKLKRGRELIPKFQFLEDYFNFLKIRNLKDETFSLEEFELLNFVFFNTQNFNLKDDFEVYKRLLEEIEPKEKLIKILYKKFPKNIINIDRRIYDFYDKELILEIIDKDNYKNTPIKDFDILKKCLYFNNFDSKIFNNSFNSDTSSLTSNTSSLIPETSTLTSNTSLLTFDNNLLLKLYNDEKDKIFRMNLKHFCSENNIQIFNEKVDYKTLAEIDIENCKDPDLVIEIYKKDKEIINRINNLEIIKEMCLELGFDEILNNFDLKFILNFSKNIEINLDLLEYLLNRFNIEDLLEILKDHSEKLIHFQDHKDFIKMKVIMKELICNAEKLKYVFDNMKFEKNLDLIFLYKKEYNFINEYKDQLININNNIDNNIELWDYLICFTDYEDIRIINKISTELIKKQKRSILILFEKYGNIMIPFVREFVMNFDYSKYKKDQSLLKLNPNILLKNIIEFDKIDIYEYQIIQILKHKKDIKLDIINTENTDIIYAIIKHKFINEVEYDISHYLDILFTNNQNLFMKLNKFYNQDIKDLYFNKIINEKCYDLINKHFSHINLNNEDVLYEYLQDFYKGEEIETQISILSNNIRDIKKFNKEILEYLDKNTEKTLILINKMVDINNEYESCHKEVHKAILLLLDSRNENIRTLSRSIYDKIIKSL